MVIAKNHRHEVRALSGTFDGQFQINSQIGIYTNASRKKLLSFVGLWTDVL